VAGHAAGGPHVAVPDIAGDVDLAADVAAAEQHEQLEVPALVQRDARQVDEVVVVPYGFVAVDRSEMIQQMRGLGVGDDLEVPDGAPVKTTVRP
jgi:hypothetical protein